MLKSLNIKNGFMKRRDEQALFLQRMGELIQKGYSFSEAIDFLLLPRDKSSEKLKRRILSSLQEGEPISSIIKHQFNVPSHVCAQIFFAEHHGQMGITLAEAGKYLVKRRKNQQKIKQVIQYPILLIFLAIFMMILLRKILFPRFQMLYTSIGYEPSTKLQKLLTFIEIFPTLFLIFFLMVLAIGFILYLFEKKISPVKVLIFLMKIPYVSFFLKLAHTHFFAREFSFLLKSGVSITESLLIIEKQPFRPMLVYISRILISDLKEGKKFHECISSIPVFQQELSFVIHHGQSNGRLAEELRLYSEMCFQELEEKSDHLVKYIQPAIFSFVGIFIMVIYFSIMIPLFQMMQGI
ncbi:competence type IV pilus assembly protein ComGB [Rossellomorea aquimaris]|uniref:competence type IV pilus assembly protein ComGB n=1 Tax=Rossellomorea aquimaris TaxID=189382 RepID=UPI0007D07725|nr:competence type IV pilus assembly protein ComGB [Rossellomorea aquimaris]